MYVCLYISDDVIYIQQLAMHMCFEGTPIIT
jgi:hypothetical protein